MPDADWIERRIRVTTPENVYFRYELAGPALRFFAWMIDIVVVIGVYIAVSLTLGIALAMFGGFGQLALFIILFVLWQGYFLILEGAWHGQTVGKRALGIRVLDRNGLRVTWGQSALRNLVRMVDAPLPFFFAVGGLTQAFNRNGLRLGDIVAGTVVVKVNRPIAPLSVIPMTERYEPLLQDFELCERVRRVLRVPERDLLGALALRRERIEDAHRMHLFAEAAKYFEERLEIPRPEFVSAERYILNLCTIAFLKERGTSVRERG